MSESDELTAREAGEVLARMDHFERRFDGIDRELAEINRRLALGESRFRAQDLERARATAIHKLALWIARGLLTLIGGMALWIFTHIGESWFLFWFPPKH